MGYRQVIQNSLLGNGSDGDWTLSTSGNPSKWEWNFRSLTINANKSWDQRPWGMQNFDRLIIRCLTPIVLNGKITANGIACCGLGNSWALNGGNQFGPPDGQPPSLTCMSDTVSTWPAPDILPIYGGTSPTAKVYAGFLQSGIGAYMAGESVRAGMAPSDYRRFPPDRLVNFLTGPYRIAAGTGGAGVYGTSAGKGGGGAIIIFAPAILFGTNSAIEAKGGNGTAGYNTGGGGGGSIQIWTHTPLSAGDLPKCSAAGGTSTGTGYASEAGVVIARSL